MQEEIHPALPKNQEHIIENIAYFAEHFAEGDKHYLKTLADKIANNGGICKALAVMFSVFYDEDPEKSKHLWFLALSQDIIRWDKTKESLDEIIDLPQAEKPRTRGYYYNQMFQFILQLQFFIYTYQNKEHITENHSIKKDPEEDYYDSLMLRILSGTEISKDKKILKYTHSHADGGFLHNPEILNYLLDEEKLAGTTNILFPTSVHAISINYNKSKKLFILYDANANHNTNSPEEIVYTFPLENKLDCLEKIQEIISKIYKKNYQPDCSLTLVTLSTENKNLNTNMALKKHHLRHGGLIGIINYNSKKLSEIIQKAKEDKDFADTLGEQLSRKNYADTNAIDIVLFKDNQRCNQFFIELLELAKSNDVVRVNLEEAIFDKASPEIASRRWKAIKSNHLMILCELFPDFILKASILLFEKSFNKIFLKSDSPQGTEKAKFFLYWTIDLLFKENFLGFLKLLSEKDSSLLNHTKQLFLIFPCFYLTIVKSIATNLHIKDIDDKLHYVGNGLLKIAAEDEESYAAIRHALISVLQNRDKSSYPFLDDPDEYTVYSLDLICTLFEEEVIEKSDSHILISNIIANNDVALEKLSRPSDISAEHRLNTYFNLLRFQAIAHQACLIKQLKKDISQTTSKERERWITQSENIEELLIIIGNFKAGNPGEDFWKNFRKAAKKIDGTYSRYWKRHIRKMEEIKEQLKIEREAEKNHAMQI